MHKLQLDYQLIKIKHLKYFKYKDNAATTGINLCVNRTTLTNKPS